jgi:hypothetical protein
MSISSLTCSYCGANIQADSKNCPACGAPVEEKPTSQQPLYTVVSDFQPAPPPVLEPKPAAYTPYTPSAPAKRRSPAVMVVLISVMVLLLICCACGVIFSVVNRSSNLEFSPTLLFPFLSVLFIS